MAERPVVNEDALFKAMAAVPDRPEPPLVTNTKRPILAEVSGILAERATTHGDFTDHARATQRIKDVMHSEVNWNKLTPTQREGLEMVAHKIGRILSGDPDFPDHWLDIEGYARITRERL